MLIFSTNETEAFLKATASTFAGPNKALWGQYWAGGVLFLSALAEAIHFATTGEPLPTERLSPVSKGGPLGVNYNSRFLAPDVPIKGRGGTNLSIDLLNQMDTSLRMLDPAAYLKARENVVPRAIGNQLQGEDFFGRPLDSAKERIGQFASDIGAPIPVQNLTGPLTKRFPALEGWIADNEARLGETGALVQTTGLNLRAETNAMLRDRLAKEAGFKNWSDAGPLEQEDILKANPDAAAELRRRGAESATTGDKIAVAAERIAKHKEDFFAAQTKRDETLLKDNPAEWRRESGDDNARTQAMIAERAQDFGERKPPPDKPWDKLSTSEKLATAQAEFHAAIDDNTANRQVDWDAVDKVVAGMDEEKQKLLFDSSLKGETEPRKQYIRDLQELIPYFEQRDRAWRELQDEDRSLQGYKSFDAYRDAMVKEVHDGDPNDPTDDVGWTEARVYVDKELASLSEDLGWYADDYLAEHADRLLPLLDKYDFYVPAEFQPYVGGGVR